MQSSQSETWMSGSLPPVSGPQTKTQISGSETTHVGFILPQGHQVPTAAKGFSEVSSDWVPSSFQSSLKILNFDNLLVLEFFPLPSGGCSPIPDPQSH